MKCTCVYIVMNVNRNKDNRLLSNLRLRSHYARGIKNGYCTLKRHRMFSVLTTLGEFEYAIISGDFGFVFEENSFRELS